MIPTVDQAAQWIASGYVVVAPLEHGYVYLVDAFSHDAVRTMHVLREDSPGVTSQVLVPSAKTAVGVIRQIPPAADVLMNKFWPGLLTLNLQPQVGLNWDLGDDRKLDSVSVRAPQSGFVLELLGKTGPLACASAAQSGEPPLLHISKLQNSTHEIIRICDMGDLVAGPLSTVVVAKGNSVRMLREGAITFEDLLVHVPEITRADSVNS